ncbi:retrovirus-related Pol polyprotein from transposon 17.6 [Trichonephila clavipes]|nr:retrovirus-related Pol polyprotein from transposon 17.6 [Trichonephila clavipes]
MEHLLGVQNVVADVLSRSPVGNMDGSQISCAALRTLALNSREQLIREQREDPEFGHIYRYLENPDDGSVDATVCEAGRLIPIVLNYPNEIVTSDLLSPYPTSLPERYRFLLVITDHFTKWSDLIPLRKASAQTIANALFENYISRYGAPISFISDNGPQFISEVTVNIDQVRPRQSDTISLDSHVETLYEGQRSSKGYSRSHLGKSKISRKTSSEESKDRQSNKENAGREDPRLKRVKIPLDLPLRTRIILSQRRTSSHFYE